MFICKDASQRYLLAVYWENGQLLIVIKEMMASRDLVEHAALSYPAAAAQELMDELSSGPTELYGIQVDALTATAIAGRIAEGLKKSSPRSQKHVSRIRPEFWG